MSNEKKSSFKVNDRVSWCGAVGTVAKIYDSSKGDFYPMAVQFGFGVQFFTLNGQTHIKHTEPYLKLLERPKRKVTKTVERWALIHTITGAVDQYYRSFVAAEQGKKHTIDPLQFEIVKLTGTYEVEVSDDE